ncbi:MAG: methyltransferase [Bdellovibrionota bacterium]
MNGQKLQRYPHRKHETLQAWDSADELLLEHLGTLALSGKRILILGDQFGALSSGLAEHKPTTYTDSYVSSRGIELNTKGQVVAQSELGELTGTYDVVVIRIPKNMSFFEDLLCHVSAHLHPGSKIVCGYMIKYQAKTSFDLLERLIGKTTTSLARKKARLIFADFEKSPTTSPYPLQVPIESFDVPFTQHSNLFSREKLDVGTRFLLSHLPKGDFPVILDLGCGSGVVGIAAKRLNPRSKIVFSDDSKMAVISTRANYGKYFHDDAEFHWTNCFENQPRSSVDFVLCNPPFHQGTALGDTISWQMFRDSFDALKKGGTLRVIGNSHLKYHLALKKVFGNAKTVATNSKFMIIDAIR